MVSVLVTGGRGVIGSWACWELVRRRARVVILDRSAEPAFPLPEVVDLPAVVGDLRDEEVVARVLADHAVDTVLHLAAVIGEQADRDPELAIEVNALSTAALLRQSAASEVRRFIALSTKGVLGQLDARYLHPSYEPVPVDHPPQPRDVYETTKAVVEALVRRDRAQGRSTAAVRLATTWGPGKTGETHAGFSMHTDIVVRAARGESSAVDIHPEQGYDMLYYPDVAQGLADLCLADGDLRSVIYHLGSGHLTTMGEFAQAVERVFPGVKVHLGTTLARGRNCLLDISAASADAGYRPTYSLSEALVDFRERLAQAQG